jgi:hypothetical protein
MKSSTRKFLLRLIIASLSSTATLAIISVLWFSLDETSIKILASAVGVDIAGVLALCCTGPTTSAAHRAVQVTGLAGAGLSLAGGLYLTWFGAITDGLIEVIGRAALTLLITAVAAAHASLVLPVRAPGRAARTLVTGTVLCIAAAAELIANYAMFPGFDPGAGYLRALAVILILDALGTILIPLTRRLGTPKATTAAPQAPAM